MKKLILIIVLISITHQNVFSFHPTNGKPKNPVTMPCKPAASTQSQSPSSSPAPLPIASVVPVGRIKPIAVAPKEHKEFEEEMRILSPLQEVKPINLNDPKFLTNLIQHANEKQVELFKEYLRASVRNDANGAIINFISFQNYKTQKTIFNALDFIHKDLKAELNKIKEEIDSLKKVKS